MAAWTLCAGRTHHRPSASRQRVSLVDTPLRDQILPSIACTDFEVGQAPEVLSVGTKCTLTSTTGPVLPRGRGLDYQSSANLIVLNGSGLSWPAFVLFYSSISPVSSLRLAGHIPSFSPEYAIVVMPLLYLDILSGSRDCCGYIYMYVKTEDKLDRLS